MTLSEPIVVAFKANSTSSVAFLTPFRSPTQGQWNRAALPQGRLMISGEWPSQKRILVAAIHQEGATSTVLWDSSTDNLAMPKLMLAHEGAALQVTGYGFTQAEIDAGLYASFIVVPFDFQE